MLILILLISLACSTTGIAVWKTIEAKHYKKLISTRSSVAQTCICGHTINMHMAASGRGPCGKRGCECYNFTVRTKTCSDEYALNDIASKLVTHLRTKPDNDAV